MIHQYDFVEILDPEPSTGGSQRFRFFLRNEMASLYNEIESCYKSFFYSFTSRLVREADNSFSKCTSSNGQNFSTIVFFITVQDSDKLLFFISEYCINGFNTLKIIKIVKASVLLCSV